MGKEIIIGITFVEIWVDFLKFCPRVYTKVGLVIELQLFYCNYELLFLVDNL